MALTGEDIRRRLNEFAARWGGYHGSERSEAQTFLNELLRCYGVDRKDVGATFEEPTGAGLMDMLWPGVCIVEMKRPSEEAHLDRHREQALDYWKTSGKAGVPAPRYVVLCAFHRFEIWEPGAVFTEPAAAFDLAHLAENVDALRFLAQEEPSFLERRDELTREAVALVTDLFQLLGDRRAAPIETLRDFILQCVWSMFAEDLQMIPGHLFSRLVNELVSSPRRSSADDLGQLFRWLATPGGAPAHGVYAGTPYADGGLFRTPASVHLEPSELELLRAACTFDWTRVEPAIFGSLLEGALGEERQWALGAHYTAEADILKAVLPTVVEPWRDRIASCGTPADAEAAQRDLMNYVVLDPACGSGNFLYVAYRHLRRLEAELRRRVAELRRRAGLQDATGPETYFPLTNMRGVEVEHFAVKLARVTLWMGHKLAADELGIDEKVLPLVDLSGIRRADALKVDWPRSDAIIGNPPYHGSQQIRSELGDEYAEWLKEEFGIGLKDYCVYWFRKAHDALDDGGRAGLVGTNSISQNRGRGASLDYIVRNGGVIANAISTQDWSGAAAVDVSIVNWVKRPLGAPARFVLDGQEVMGISTALRPATTDVAVAKRLHANQGRSFQGPQPVGGGFILAVEEAIKLHSRPEATYRDVVRPYLVGEDIASSPSQKPRRFIIDFGSRSLEEAMRYPAALVIARKRVKPFRDQNRRKVRREKWWLLGELVPAMRAALAPLSRYMAGTATGKRILFCWAEQWTLPSNATNVFAFDDDYSMGLLSSQVHTSWARTQSSTLEDRIRYTPTSAFDTFPWPTPTPEQREAIADLARRVIARRSEICLDRQIGLTKLYNEVDDGAYRDLAKLHRELHEAVAAAYGWPRKVAHDAEESNRRLLELNRRIAAGEVDYRPFD